MNNERVKERRMSARYKNPDIQLSYKPLDPHRWSTYQGMNRQDVKDISLGGVRLAVNENITEKMPISLDIFLKKNTDMIKTFGRVAWVRKIDVHENEIGITFNWWVKEEDKKTFVEFITQKAN
ncbi:MAG: PilZ domain-containing protein [Candidatus Omnitrophota bacterium]